MNPANPPACGGNRARQMRGKPAITAAIEAEQPSAKSEAGADSQHSDVRRILLVTDAWHPQVNGVVRTLERLSEKLPTMGVEAVFLTPAGFRSLAMPTYPEIRLALTTPGEVRRQIKAAAADHVHIVTEGPLGLMARWACLKEGHHFTTSYHTRFPEYLRARLPLPESWTYAWMRRFHNAAAATLVATPSLATELAGKGFTKLRPWTRGVDTELFNPDRSGDLGLPRPIFLYVGRVAVEKNIGAFLGLDLPGSKVVVGDGPAMAQLKARHTDAHFLGERTGLELARIYASSDVFVFPSRTDTFGIVLLEALASGLPIAAYPVTGPIDIVGDGTAGVLSEDLGAAAQAALTVDRQHAREKALGYSWKACAEMFVGHVRDVHGKHEQAIPAGSAP
ncbi:glycosyltransferase family 1 protein [Mesorhizobium sp. BAC0120]|uniref:glycosyltransferase family 4 protein n=1 Tax=Mesorhizobium sp. BAC0120 TaxID=3090670 RepID=UPI00298D445D|nr:glycosyltransferase family 1 protein [Mesorhizobium sp. BAC0120]MDW6022840.1 glycosyltransferase family 1 protein [Mesorhizobium sp. BAC0120]